VETVHSFSAIHWGDVTYCTLLSSIAVRQLSCEPGGNADSFIGAAATDWQGSQAIRPVDCGLYHSMRTDGRCHRDPESKHDRGAGAKAGGRDSMSAKEQAPGDAE
jgi:hypothetical protein